MAFECDSMVVCIDDRWVSAENDAPCDLTSTPIKGIVYTIWDSFTDEAGETWLVLDELNGFQEWNADSFRPISKPNIQLFKKLLRPTNRQNERGLEKV